MTLPADATRMASVSPRGFQRTLQRLDNWLTASLRHCIVTPRGPQRRVRLTASRDASTTLDSDDWPAWDDRDSDVWSTECDYLPDLGDDESLTTTMAT